MSMNQVMLGACFLRTMTAAMALSQRFFPSFKHLIVITALGTSQHLLADTSAYESALADMQQGDVSSAVIKIKNLLQETPDNIPARILYAEILQQYGEFAAAQEQYERAISLDVDENLVIVPLARLMLLRGEYRALIGSIEVGGRPDDIQAALLLIRGDAFLKLRDLDGAEQSYRRANALLPGDITAQLGFAQIALQKNDSALFEQLIEKAKIQHPDNGVVWYLQGTYLQQQRDEVAAIEAYSRAIALQPDLFDARKSRAAVLLDQNRVDLAMLDVDFMLAETSDDPYTLFLKVLGLRKLEQFDVADAMLDDLKNKMSLVPDDVLAQHFELRRAKAMTDFYLGNYSEAIRQLRQLISLQPQNYALRVTISNALAAQNRNREALEHLSLIPLNIMSLNSVRAYITALFESDKDLELISVYERLSETLQKDTLISKFTTLAKINANQFQPQSGQAGDASTDELLVKGYGLLSSGDKDAAHVVAQQIESRADQKLEALNFVGSSYQAQGQLEIAMSFFERAKQLSPNDLLVNLNIAQIFIEQKRLNAATELLNEQVELFPEDIRVLFLLARIAQLAGDHMAAADYYERVNTVSPLEQNTLLNWLDALLLSQQFDKAGEVVYQLEQINKFSPAVLFGKAQAQLGVADYQGANRSLRTLLGAVGNSPPHLMQIGKMFVRLSNEQEVDDVIQRLEQISGQRDNVDRLRVDYLILRNDLAGAENLATRLTRRTKNSTDYRQLSDIQLRQNDIQSAISAAKQAHSVSGSAQHLPYLTSLYWRDNQHSAIKSLYTQWLAVNDSDLASRRVFANYLQQTQDFDAAKEQYLSVLALESSDPFSLINLMTMDVILGSFESARRWLAKADESLRQDPVVMDLEGWIVFQLGDKQHGLSLMRESFVRNARNPLNLYHLGNALIELNRVDEGQAMLKRFKQLSNPTTQMYLTRLNN